MSFFCSINPLSASLKSFRIGIEVDEHRNPHHLRLGDECATRKSIIAFPWSASSAPEIQDTCYGILYPSKHSASGLRLRIGILSICGRRRRVPYNKNTQWCSLSLSLSLSKTNASGSITTSRKTLIISVQQWGKNCAGVVLTTTLECLLGFRGKEVPYSANAQRRNGHVFVQFSVFIMLR